MLREQPRTTCSTICRFCKIALIGVCFFSLLTTFERYYRLSKYNDTHSSHSFAGRHSLCRTPLSPSFVHRSSMPAPSAAGRASATTSGSRDECAEATSVPSAPPASYEARSLPYLSGARMCCAFQKLTLFAGGRMRSIRRVIPCARNAHKEMKKHI